MANRILQFSIAKNKVYQDSSFTQSESPRVLEVETDLGRPANFGFIICDGAGDITMEIQNKEQDGYGDSFTFKDGETILLNGLNIKRMRLTWVSNSAYRLLLA